MTSRSQLNSGDVRSWIDEEKDAGPNRQEPDDPLLFEIRAVPIVSTSLEPGLKANGGVSLSSIFCPVSAWIQPTGRVQRHPWENSSLMTEESRRLLSDQRLGICRSALHW